MSKKIIVVGGVAGGANFCTRARRLSETAQIILVERGPYISFANCGLPYHIGGEIKERDKLIVQTPKSLGARFNLDIRIQTEAIKIFPDSSEIELREVVSGRTYLEKYDELVLSPGAAPIIPALPGLDREGVFTLRTIENVGNILGWIDRYNPKSAVVVGGGYVGLEVLEQLHVRIGNLTLIEAAPQLLAPLDSEMAILVEKEISSKNIAVFKGEAIVGIEHGDSMAVLTSKGRSIPADLVILALGVKPEVEIARAAGIAIGERGGIAVNDYLQTSISNIWALGDAIEVKNLVTGELAPIPLAGPANRQGRLVADNILGRRRTYRGTLGTAIVRVFGLTAATAGANERTLKRLAMNYKSLYLYPKSHAGYYPGASLLAIKILVCPQTRKLLGAQVVGEDGVDKRIDIFATAILSGLTVDEIAELELAYAPPFGSAKDPVNIAGMAAQNLLDGLVETITPVEFEGGISKDIPDQNFILDVRDEDELDQGSFPNANWIPLNQLRKRMNELPKGKPITVACASGQRSYYAARILKLSGFTVQNLTGAFRAWSQHLAAKR